MSNECMSLPPLKPKTCPWCHKEFIPSSPASKFCGDTCRKEHSLEQGRGYRLVYKQKRKTNNGDSIVDVNKQAKNHGMSYGQYVAKMKGDGNADD